MVRTIKMVRANMLVRVDTMVKVIKFGNNIIVRAIITETIRW